MDEQVSTELRYSSNKQAMRFFALALLATSSFVVGAPSTIQTSPTELMGKANTILDKLADAHNAMAALAVAHHNSPAVASAVNIFNKIPAVLCPGSSGGLGGILGGGGPLSGVLGNVLGGNGDVLGGLDPVSDPLGGLLSCTGAGPLASLLPGSSPADLLGGLTSSTLGGVTGGLLGGLLGGGLLGGGLLGGGLLGGNDALASVLAQLLGTFQGLSASGCSQDLLSQLLNAILALVDELLGAVAPGQSCGCPGALAGPITNLVKQRQSVLSLIHL
ncbi:hypothetical protein MKEN_00937500 [Mycena kentingensis (nom. inval.)]|nr:hypothetical protein MKEN_00937500 [Mycena kentingensis (nom. inval.)]